jgi:signal transduction histidine kinase
LFCSKERLPKLQSEISPGEIARDVFELFRARAERASIRLELDVRDESRGVYDPEAIHNLLANLIANAIDACRFDPTEDGKQHTITVKCLRNVSGDCVIEVRDNGAGIPEQDSHKVFHSFFSSKGTEGTGLGLFVVQKVVHQHGGTITFDTQEGKGTTFTAVLRSQEKMAAE